MGNKLTQPLPCVHCGKPIQPGEGGPTRLPSAATGTSAYKVPLHSRCLVDYIKALTRKREEEPAQ